MTTATIEVDFHFKADEEHTYGLLAEVRPAAPVTVGQQLLATDGDVTHWALVDGIDEDRGSLLLRIMWDQPVPVPYG